MDETEMQNALSRLLGLHGTELLSMMAILRHCAVKGGVPLGAVGAVGMSGAGAVALPGLGAVPGWLAGFGAGFVSGTLMCSMAQRGVVIEALKRSLSAAGLPVRSEREALDALHAALAKLGPAPTVRTSA